MRYIRQIVSLVMLFTAVQSLLADLCNLPSCKCDATSRTFLWVRPLFQLQSPEYFSAFRCNRARLKEDGIHGAAQIVPLGSRSVNSLDLARYFFPNCNTSLITDEILNVDQEVRDLLATNFNIFTAEGTAIESTQGFRSIISIRPRQTNVGFGVQYRQSFCENYFEGRGFWASISFPVLHVKNNMHFCEDVISDGDGVTTDPLVTSVLTPMPNMTAAFQQDAWCFGKISPCSQSKTGVADITLQLGYEWLAYEPCHLESYIGVLIPTGNTPNAKYLFQPIVGNGHHVGVLFGNIGGIHIWRSCDEEMSFRMEWAAHSQYLFNKRQIRSFDIQNKPWSRYATTYENQEQAIEAFLTNQPFLNTPGINVFTRAVNVTPGFSYNMITAFVFNYCLCQAEVGYNFYARRADCVTLACPWEQTVALKNRIGRGNSNPVRDITGNLILESVSPLDFPSIAVENYEQNTIPVTQLDLQSAAHPCMLTHTFYGAWTYNTDYCDYPVFSSIGGSYEFSNSNNAVVSRWVLWGKAGMSF